jgi:hypothetical protein
MSSRSGPVNLTASYPAIFAQVGLEIPKLLARPDFESDAAGVVVVEKQPAVSQDTLAEVDRGTIQDNDLDRLTEELGELGFEVKGQTIEAGRGDSGK